jgi:hypothetical protein
MYVVMCSLIFGTDALFENPVIVLWTDAKLSAESEELDSVS